MHPADHRLRLLLAIGIYDPASGGASEWLWNYASWLVARGHEVCVVCEQAAVRVPAPCALLTLSPSQYTKNSWARAAALQKLVESRPADIVYDTGCLRESDVFHPLMGSLIHNWQRQLRAFPSLLRFRRFWHVRMWRDVRLQWHQCRHHRQLVACSQRVAADFAQLGCRNPAIIPNGILEPAIPAPQAVQKLRQELNLGDRLLILVTASNFYLKGVMTVLKTFACLDAETRNKFLVVITGRNRDEAFSQYIQRHNLADCCQLAGWVENIDDYYHVADIFLHPTYHDAGSLSTLKALAAGCAVVTSRFDGSADMIQDGINGLVLARPGDTDELAAVLRRLLDVGLRQRLGAAARQLAPVISQEHQFQKLEELCFSVLAAKNRLA
jgi:glycosyltransferase involved in cell wall biosynthesis